MTRNLSKYTRQLLFCPGPVNLASNVKRSSIIYEIGHREPEFSNLLLSLNSKLLQLFKLRKPHLYHPVIITGSGTAANEAMLSSAVGDKKILVVSNGEFGERLLDISNIHNSNTCSLKFNWAQKIDTLLVEEFVKRQRIEFVAM